MAPTRPGPVRRPTKFYQLGLNYVNYTNAGKPSSYEEATTAPDADTWIQAMRSKMDSIHENKTWELVELLTGWKTLPFKWVYRYQYVSSSEQPKYKARVVAKRFKQEHELNYNELFHW